MHIHIYLLIFVMRKSIFLKEGTVLILQGLINTPGFRALTLTCHIRIQVGYWRDREEVQGSVRPTHRSAATQNTGPLTMPIITFAYERWQVNCLAPYGGGRKTVGLKGPVCTFQRQGWRLVFFFFFLNSQSTWQSWSPGESN